MVFFRHVRRVLGVLAKSSSVSTLPALPTLASCLVLATGCGSTATSTSLPGPSPEAESAHLDALAQDTQTAWQSRIHGDRARRIHLQSLGQAVLPQASSRGASLVRLLDRHRSLFRLQDVEHSLLIDNEDVDDLGMTHVHLRQVVRGVPVLHGEILAHFGPEGTLRTVDAHVSPEAEGLSTIPNFAGEEALAKADAYVRKAWGPFELRRTPQQELAIDTPEEQAPRLTYHVNMPVAGEQGMANLEVFVDALSGEVFDAYDSLNEIKGSGKGVDGKTKSLNVAASSSGYVLYDATRGSQGIRTNDCKNRQDRNCSLIASKSPDVWDDSSVGPGAAVDAHVHLGVVYDYFKGKHNRLGIDGKDGPLVGNVHYERRMNNAFWDGTEMFFGDGDGTSTLPFSGALDVVAHELTHGLVQHTAGLDYRKQSGALNESVADIFGVFVAHEANPTSKTLWLLGVDLRRDGIPIRDMRKPTARQQPAHMSKYVKTTQDNGGVHINSGIPNNAAFLMTEGGVNETSKVQVRAGIGWEKSEKVWYRTVTRYLTATSGFREAAEGTLTAAKDLGLSQDEQNIIECAWMATGVLPGTCKPIALPPPPGPGPGSGPVAPPKDTPPVSNSPAGSSAAPTNAGPSGTASPAEAPATPEGSEGTDPGPNPEPQGFWRTEEVSACAVGNGRPPGLGGRWSLVGAVGLLLAARRGRRRSE